MSKVVVLGSPDTSPALDRWVRVVRDARGTYFAGPTIERGKIVAFDASGRLRRVIGRPGRGPGELLVPFPAAITSDELLVVVDLLQSRLTMFSGNGDVVRTISPAIPMSWGRLIPLADGRIVAARDIRSPELAGLSIHLLSQTGARVRSFGPARPEVALNAVVSERLLADAGNGQVWSARRDRYEFALSDTSGKLRGSYKREASWFEEGPPNPSTRMDEFRPASRVVDLWQDEHGLLWIVSMVADSKWRAARRVSAEEARRERGVVPLGEYDKYLDTVIEVFDPKAGKLVTSHRVDLRLAGFAGHGCVYGFREDSDGFLFVDVWKLELRHATPTSRSRS